MENYEKAERDYMAGMKYKDIAKKYHVSINTVKSWKRRHKWHRHKYSSLQNIEKGGNIRCAIPKKTSNMVKKEIFKPIQGTGDKYFISNHGRVLRKNKRGEYVYCKISQNDKGYRYFKVYLNGKKETISLHRAVAQTFIDNPMNYPEVNHIDEDKGNNNVGNLEWCTARYNNCYGTRLEKQVKTRMAVSNLGKEKE